MAPDLGERIEVARVLPFCPLPSWYISHWYERADAPRPAGRLVRFAVRLARRALYPNEKRPVALVLGTV